MAFKYQVLYLHLRFYLCCWINYQRQAFQIGTPTPLPRRVTLRTLPLIMVTEGRFGWDTKSILCFNIVSCARLEEGKRDLVIMRTASHSSTQKLGVTNQIRDFYLLLNNAIIAAHAMAGHAIFVVVRDIFFNYCIPRERLAVRIVTRPLFPPFLPLPFWHVRLTSTLLKIHFTCHTPIYFFLAWLITIVIER